VLGVTPDQAFTIGDYVLDPTPIESGAFGTVYNARRRADGKRAALKLVLSTAEPDSADKLAAERRGAELQQQFGRSHGMVPEVYEYGAHHKHFYIAMEYVEGGSLAHLIAAGPMAPSVAARHALCICEFLDKAHQFLTIEGEPGNAIVHADLKPQHILLPRPGEIRVLDFGIAKALAKTRQVTTNIWGTICYASPEQLESGGVNPYVDFWSVGVMLYEMVAGHRPYAQHEKDSRRLERAIKTNERREPLPESCPPALAAIINKLLAYQPERRYPSAAAIRADLEAFLSERLPAALSQYEVPPTTTIARPELPAAMPPPLPPPLPPTARSPSDMVPATDPLPLTGVTPALPTLPLQHSLQRPTLPSPLPDPLPDPPAGRRLALRRLAWLATLLALVAVLALEGAAWVAAERFRQTVDAIDGRTVIERKGDYDRISGLGALDLGLSWRVDGPLRERLVSIANAVITDYRGEEPTVGAVEWRQASDALRWAQQLAPGDAALRARQVNCEGHEARIAAQRQPRGSALRRQLFATAIARFQRAAELDPASYDPYLGISRTQVYGFDDVEAATAAITEAEKRGYHSSRRERAQLGDGYLRRAEKSRRLAGTVSGDQRRRELENAHAGYGRCVELFDPIIGFGNAAHNLEFCKRNLRAVAHALDLDGEAVDEP
jgi:serine/threonine protein kinase